MTENLGELYPEDIDAVMHEVFGEPDGLTDDARKRYRMLADNVMRYGSPSSDCNVFTARATLQLELGETERVGMHFDRLLQRLSVEADSKQ